MLIKIFLTDLLIFFVALPMIRFTEYVFESQKVAMIFTYITLVTIFLLPILGIILIWTAL